MKFILVNIFIIMSTLVFSDVINLKNGEIINGKILFDTDGIYIIQVEDKKVQININDV
jgi:hypothetical protein